MIRFTVYGDAQPAGSKRSMVPLDKNRQPFRNDRGGVVVSTVDDNPNSLPWKAVVAHAGRIAQGFGVAPQLEGCVRLVLVFYRPRPKGHLTEAGQLNAKGRRTPAPPTKPDVLKLARAVEDALTGVLWKDDAQIVDEHLFKRWGSPARVEVLAEAVTEVLDFD